MSQESSEKVVSKSADRVQETPRQSDAGTREIAASSQTGTKDAAWTDNRSVEQSFANATKLNLGPNEKGGLSIDVPKLNTAANVGDGVQISQPPKDAKPNGGADTSTADASTRPLSAGTSERGLTKTDGKIDMPAQKPENMKPEEWEAMRKQVDKLNEHLNDPKHQLTDNQKKDIERSAEQLMTNKNPDGTDRKPPLTDMAQVTKTLEQANRMFDNEAQINANGFTNKDRNMTVTSMVHDAANYKDINQGHNSTCNVTSVARAEIMQTPGNQAERVADMFINDNKDPANHNMNYIDMKTADGGSQRVYYDKESLKASNNAESQLAESQRGSGARDAYVQAVNHLYVNAEMQKYGAYYTDTDRVTNSNDTGERLHKGSFNGDVVMGPDGKTPRQFGMVMEDVGDISKKVGVTSAADYDRYGLKDGSNVLKVDATSAASLDAAWAKNGGKPLVIGVDTNAAMFSDATGGGKTAGGGHVITLVDQRVNPETGKTEYLMMNNWGDKNNGWVSSDAMASAFNPSKGDRSGNVPVGRDQQNLNPEAPVNPQDQQYRRPGVNDGGGQGGKDQPQYGRPTDPERANPGVKTDDAKKEELDWRNQLQKQLEEQKKKDEEDEAARKRKAAADRAAQEEFDRLAALKRQQDAGGSQQA